MALNIKDPEAHELARRLAKLTGASLTQAVKAALRAAIAREGPGRLEAAATLVEDLDAIAVHCAALPVLDGRPAEAILGYDGRGVPA